MRIPSIYWGAASVPPEAAAAVERLASLEFSVDERRAALLQLLASDHVVARSLALDYYSMCCASQRHGDNPIIEEAIVTDAVRTAALRELAAPAYEHAEPGAGPARGANHASALHALPIIHGMDDAPLLVRILRENVEPGVLERVHPEVLDNGVSAAGAVLAGESAHPELAALVDVLSRISRLREVDPRTRASAITAIGGMADEAVTPLLVAGLVDPELAISAAAARRLLERDLGRHLPLVAPVAAAWQTPEFPPYDLLEVRQMLEDARGADRGEDGSHGG